VERSIATTFDPPRPFAGARRSLSERLDDVLGRADPAVIGVVFVALALAIYYLSDPSRSGWYNHFVWQADAFLHGRFPIAYPVIDGQYVNGYFQDVMLLPGDPGKASYALLPFPPLPAVLLLPFSAVFGLATNSQLFGVALGAVNVGLAWRMTSRLTERRSVSALATIFFAFGTVAWYASMLSTTWFLAHVVAMTFTLLAITLALDGERREQAATTLGAMRQRAAARNSLLAGLEGSSMFLSWYRRARPYFEPVQFMAGFVFGVAALSRLTVIFGAPFFLFVGPGGSIFKRGASAALGAVIPVGLLLLYNLLSSGHLFNPAYDYLYHTEYLGYMPPGLRIDTSLGIEDIGHIPLNLRIMFGWMPDVPAGCSLSSLVDCIGTKPSQIGMSLLLTSPAYLLVVPVLLAKVRNRVVVGSAIAVVCIAFVNLMHFSQGWVQFGYRFSNDFAPFALVLVTLAIAWLSRWAWTYALCGLLVLFSVIVNAWGVYWGVTLGW
jgi:hypothetical protein